MKFENAMVQMNPDDVIRIIEKNVQIIEESEADTETLGKLRRYEKLGDSDGILIKKEGELLWYSMKEIYFRDMHVWPIENLVSGRAPSKEWFVRKNLKWWIETFVGDEENFVTKELWERIPTIIKTIFELKV